MKDTLLFSDVHLKPYVPGDKDHADFLNFLGQIDPLRVDRVICVGDLFDFWFEYRHAVFASYFEALRLLADLNRAGVELHLFRGNHDLWAGPQLERLTGMHVHKGPDALPFGGQEALILHGDGLNSRDYGYRLFKRVALNRAAQCLFRRIHPDTAMAFARRVSRRSRAMANIENPADGPEAEAVRRHARHLIGSGRASIVICGHAHAPVIERVDAGGSSGLYVNSGDWPLHRSYIRFSGEEFSLHTFC